MVCVQHPHTPTRGAQIKASPTSPSTRHLSDHPCQRACPSSKSLQIWPYDIHVELLFPPPAEGLSSTWICPTLTTPLGELAPYPCSDFDPVGSPHAGCQPPLPIGCICTGDECCLGGAVGLRNVVTHSQPLWVICHIHTEQCPETPGT